jgi:hypothetical protein
MTPVLMACGHSTHAVQADTREPVCVICVGIDPRARVRATPEQETAATEGRMMRCSYTKGQDGKPCHARLNPVPSNTSAAFFNSRPGEDYDQFYCGCWGWD